MNMIPLTMTHIADATCPHHLLLLLLLLPPSLIHKPGDRWRKTVMGRCISSLRHAKINVDKADRPALYTTTERNPLVI